MMDEITRSMRVAMLQSSSPEIWQDFMTESLITISDYEARAREIVPATLFDRLFGAHGSPRWITNTSNMAAFESIKLKPRVMVDLSHRKLSTTVLGEEISFPIILAPVGAHMRAHPEGELATTRAAGAAGTVVALSSASTYSIEEVAAVANGPLWFQTYVFRDRELTEVIVRRAENAGYSALLVTVDNMLARSTEREYLYPNIPGGSFTLSNFVGIDRPNLPTLERLHDHYDVGLSWSDLKWLRSITGMPIVIKGIQTAEDALLCIEHGADALIVSNHGGHSLQGTLGTIEMLPEVIEAVGDRLEVYLDSGIRRGTDVLKALALGAKAVLIGRAMLWGLAVDGEAGVSGVLKLLRQELDVAMGLCGVADVNQVDKNLVQMPSGTNGPVKTTDQLERLTALMEKGHLTRDEFDAAKAKVLGR